ncbi:MAG: hypothetical protein ACPGWR_05865 [Ardenticatenaceae bacterium]
MQTTETDILYAKLVTGARPGEVPTPETIRQGTVRMEDHPDYEATLQKAKDAGFEIQWTDKDPYVEVIEVYDQNRNFIRLEKKLCLQKGMRYLDLEHEWGHIEQFSRFGDKLPPTEKLVELPNGRRYKYNIRDGILTASQSTIMEYHNRLVEFIHLHSRGVELELLTEHASGVNFWRDRYWRKGLGKGNSSSKRAWANKYFGDIDDLSVKYDQIIQEIN